MAQTNNRFGFVVGVFLAGSAVVALAPTRERQLYLFDCSTNDGLVTKTVGRMLDLPRDMATFWRGDPYQYRDCFAGRGFLAAKVLSPEEEFANTPLYAITRAIGRSRSVVDSVPRTGRRLTGQRLPNGVSTGPAFAGLIPEGSIPLQGPANLPAAGGSGDAKQADPGSLFGGGPDGSPIGAAPAAGGAPAAVPMPPPVPTPPPSPPPVPVVPEPSTWLMMLIGFFGLGAAMRRRQRPVGALAGPPVS